MKNQNQSLVCDLKIALSKSKMANENKLVKTVTDAAVLVGLSAGVGWVGKKVLKESFTNDPSSNFMNYGKWIVALSASIYLKDYLQDKKVIPTSL